VHRVVDDLVAQGHIPKRLNPDHARADLVSLAADGRALLHALWRESDRHRLALLVAAGVTRSELDHTRDVLRRIIAAFNTVPGTCAASTDRRRIAPRDRGSN
jgi:DNA-binding MarR family transcriptional regulator